MMDTKMTEICYQIVCEFEKSFLEHFKEQEDGKIAFFSFDLEDTHRQFPTQSLTYTSYKNLFEEQYKDAFLTSIASFVLCKQQFPKNAEKIPEARSYFF